MIKIFIIIAVLAGLIVADSPSWLGTWLVTSSYTTNAQTCGNPKFATNVTSFASGSGFKLSFYNTQGTTTTDYFDWSPSQLSGSDSIYGWTSNGNITVSGNFLIANLFLNHTDYSNSWCGWTMVRYFNPSAMESDDLMMEDFSDDLMLYESVQAQDSKPFF